MCALQLRQRSKRRPSPTRQRWVLTCGFDVPQGGLHGWLVDEHDNMTSLGDRMASLFLHVCKTHAYGLRMQGCACSGAAWLVGIMDHQMMMMVLMKRRLRSQVDRLMDLIVNSLYSNREVFLRELVSNASDALDKLRFISLTDPDVLKGDDAMEIRIRADKDARTITIE